MVLATYSGSEAKEHTLLSDNRNRNSRPGGIFSGGKIYHKLLLLAAVSIIETGIYAAVVKLEYMPGYIAIYILTAVLAVLTFLFSGAGRRDIPTRSELRDDWSDEKKDSFIKMLTRWKRISSVLSIFLLPLLFIVGFDFVKVAFFS